MANLYLLPCPSCQHSLEVSTRQAGQSLTCTACASELEAPKLGDLKKLAPSEQISNNSSRSMSSAGRWLFTVGLALAVLAGLAGAGLQNFASNLQTEFNAEEILEQNKKQLSTMPLEGVYQVASLIEANDKVGVFKELPFVKSNKQGTILNGFAYALYAVAGIGVLMLVGAFLRK